MQSQTKNCQNCKQDFTIEPDDFSFYEKMKVPAPTWCSNCRMQRRLVWRNERFLFRRKDDQNGGELFSGFPSEADLKTYKNDYWHGGDWDPMSYGLNYDFSKNFFNQFKILFSQVPLPAKSSAGFMENSDYCNEAGRLRNAYLCFDSDFVDDSAYLVKATNIKDTYDSHEIIDDELCYEDVMVYKSYRTFFSLDCESCVDVWFSKGLRGCTNCFGCVNLAGKSYYWFNEALTKEDYEKKFSDFHSDSFFEVEEMKERIADFWSKYPVKFYHGIRNISCTGERIFDSRNVKNSVSVTEGENMRYIQISVLKAANSYDCVQLFMGAENAYECVTCGEGSYNLKFCFNCWAESRDLEYCGYCINCSDCFGCLGLKNKQYCILNKQYSKDEYFLIREKIIENMNLNPYMDKFGNQFKYGEFFPAILSPLAYNESLAQDYMPLDQEKANERGFVWRLPNKREFQVSLAVENLPDSIDEVNEEILKEVIGCVECKKAYRIIQQELQFYKRIKLPLPRKCHNCRFLKRFSFINPPYLWGRECMCQSGSHTNHKNKCEVKFDTSYSPNRLEIVYCEKCYQQEVY